LADDELMNEYLPSGVLVLGALFSSSYEFPGRYARWTLGFVNPPLRVTGRGRSFGVTALNDRGLVLLTAIQATLATHDHVTTLEYTSDKELKGTVATSTEVFAEEDRSKQPSLFSVVRAIQNLFYHEGEAQVWMRCSALFFVFLSSCSFALLLRAVKD